MANRLERSNLEPQQAQGQVQETNAFFFSYEKITRLALRILSWFTYGTAIYAAAHVITGTISPYHILSALSLWVLSQYTSKQANSIIDFNDPKEVEWVRDESGFVEKNMTEMLLTYPIETILKYNLCTFNLLRTRCYVNLLERRYNPVPTLRENADKLLRHRIITPEMHRALVDDNIDFFRNLPGNTIEMEALFRAFDEIDN